MDLEFVFESIIYAVSRAALMATPVFLIVLAITASGRRWLAPAARQALWSLVLLRMLLPVSIVGPPGLPRGAFPWTDRAAAMLSSGDTVYAILPSAPLAEEWSPILPPVNALPAPDQPPGIGQAASFDWRECLATSSKLMLIVGMGLVVVWTAVATLRLRRWVRAGSNCQRQDWLDLLAEGRRRFGVSRLVALRTVPRLKGPATHGWRRPTILLPVDATNWTNVELKHVLWHELAHVQRHDVATNWVLALVRIGQWWNPMFWWAQRAWLCERESACDALVLRQLEGSDAREYGHTLLRFLERLSKQSAGLPANSPGIVLFWGRKREARRRLAELARLARPEPLWRSWLAGGLIAALAICGLTDAAPPPTENPATPLELPPGTSWNSALAQEVETDSPRTTREYVLAATVERLRQDDPNLDAKMAAEELRLLLMRVLQPVVPPWPIEVAKSPGEMAKSTKSSCVLRGEDLVALATAAEHQEVERLLKLWSANGLRQTSIEIRFMATEQSLRELLPTAGGTVSNPAAGALSTSTDNLGAGFARNWTQVTVPTFVRVLNPVESLDLCDKLQANLRGNTVLAPKITNFDGLSTQVYDAVQRPFVTGLITRDDGAIQPQVSVVGDGLRLEFRTELAAGQSTRLFVRYEESQVLEVDVLETIAAGGSASVQIPRVSQCVVAATTEIPPGHSLLVAPLRRNPQGQLRLCLIRPTPLP